MAVLLWFLPIAALTFAQASQPQPHLPSGQEVIGYVGSMGTGGLAGLIMAAALWRKAGADRALMRDRVSRLESELQAKDARFRRISRHRRRQVKALEAQVARLRQGETSSTERISKVETEVAAVRALQDSGLIARSDDDLPSWPDGRPLVMIVDDDRDTTKKFGKLLFHHGFDFIIALTVADAIEQLGLIDPKWILVDLCMGPDCSGLDVIRAANVKRPAARSMVITGVTDPMLLAEAEALAPVMVKPIKLTGLLETLRSLPDRAPVKDVPKIEGKYAAQPSRNG